MFVTTSGRPVLRRNEVECFLLSSVDLDSEDDPQRFTSLRSYHTDEKTRFIQVFNFCSSVASSSKVVYPDTAQMIVYDPTKKSGSI
ncbi:hypothetical protein HID58_062556 [Brassica napus]|uniref:Uncharacterized protein n=1 Tax=Brassica napus TaxID=3708 RepID=A0ABQ8A1U1_BRANA|nr:hypothetical protein HID58_062556 [Brassica napus]